MSEPDKQSLHYNHIIKREKLTSIYQESQPIDIQYYVNGFRKRLHFSNFFSIALFSFSHTLQLCSHSKGV